MFGRHGEVAVMECGIGLKNNKLVNNIYGYLSRLTDMHCLVESFTERNLPCLNTMKKNITV